METIYHYTEEAIALLADYDKTMKSIQEECERTYPDPPTYLREILGEEKYAEIFRERVSRRTRTMLEDPIYQACVRGKVRVMDVTPCTYRFDASEINPHE